MDVNWHFLTEELQNISNDKITLFGLSCVDRILHLYQNFEEEISTETGDYFSMFKHGYSSLGGFLNKAFESILDKSAIIHDLSEFSNECLNFAPDTEDISSIFAVIAQNCAIGLSYVFQYFSNHDIQCILYCQRKVIETIDVISFFKKENENILNSKLEHEAIIEKEILSLIKGLSYLKDNDIKIVRDFDRENAISL